MSFTGHFKTYIEDARTLGRWIVVSTAIGTLCGVLGSAFHIGIEVVTVFRETHPWVIFTLPAAGLLAVAIYRIFKVEGLSTDTIIGHVQTGEGIELELLPAIFLATVVTHFSGGSAGREGAAFQMGGVIGLGAGRLFRFDEIDQRTATMAGMAAFFSALFGTPVAATVFVMAVISVGALHHAAFIPCFAASLAAYATALFLGIAPTHFSVTVPEMTPVMVVTAAVLAWLCSMLAIVFCEALRRTEHAAHRLIANPWIRAAVGGAIILGLTLLVGTQDYNGAGMGIIVRAIEQGEAEPLAFIWKIIFTVITLSAGFKGGEVVPCFFIGACFGCTVGPLIGIPAGFAAAIGLISVFCSAVNCPIASIILAVELFGANGLIFYALCCGLSYVLSGYSGFYSSQRILYDKFKLRRIDVHTNARHEDDLPQRTPKGR